MSKLRLSLACWNYDRTRSLMDGSVQPDGIDLIYLNLPGRGDLFPDAATPRVRRRGNVAVVVHGFDVPRAAAVRRDSDLSFALLPSFVHLRQRRRRHPRAEGPDRQTHRHARVPDDRAGVDPRDPVRPLRRAGRQRHLLHRRRGGARPLGKAQARPAGQYQDRADRRDADAGGDARERRDRRAAHGANAVDVLDRQRQGAAAVSRTTRRSSSTTSARPASFRSCTPW